MKRLFTILGVLVLILVGVLSPSAISASHASVLTIGITSDIHDNWTNLGLFVSSMNKWLPDFVVEDGDIATNPTQATYDAFLAKWRTLRVPRYDVVGNHDALNKPLWSSRIGKPYYRSFDRHGYHVVILDTSSGTVDDTQLTWLRADLAASDLVTLVFTHVSIAPFPKAWKYPNGIITNGAAVRTVFEADGDVVAVFTGHNHTHVGDDWHVVRNGVHYFSIASLSEGVLYSEVLVRGGDVLVNGIGIENDAIPGDIRDWPSRRR